MDGRSMRFMDASFMGVRNVSQTTVITKHFITPIELWRKCIKPHTGNGFVTSSGVHSGGDMGV